MIKWKIPLYKVASDNEDLKIISRVIKRGMSWAIGPEIEQFEKLLAEYVGIQYCVAVNSGTSALHASLLATGLKDNEVIVPSFTFIATSNAVLMTNSKPKFVDIEEERLGLDPHKIEQSISKKTKIIIPVHYAGLPCKIEEIKEISKQNKLLLIEDAAESLGSWSKKRMVGTFGNMSVFSFAGNKIITTGEGGAVTTNSKEIFEKLKLIRSHGRLDKKNYFSSIDTPQYVMLGYNWRMSSITAALAISQLQKIEKIIELRRQNAKYLSLRLRKFKTIITPQEPIGTRHVYQLYSIRLPNFKIRNQLIKFLTKNAIMSKVFFDPVHSTVFYKKLGYDSLNLNTTKKISEQILSLPLYPSMKKEELDYLVESIHEFMEREKLE